jgi:hypothetical protein
MFNKKEERDVNEKLRAIEVCICSVRWSDAP